MVKSITDIPGNIILEVHCGTAISETSYILTCLCSTKMCNPCGLHAELSNAGFASPMGDDLPFFELFISTIGIVSSSANL